jgi:nucleoside-diphosphate-sugar epimerase
LHTACVRPFSGYGEEQDLTYPVPSIALRAAKHESPLTVWGSGLQGRDFVHIDDCIEAILRILAAVNDGSAINIGSGKLINFREVAGLFAKLEGYETEIKPLEDKPVGVHSRYADISHMKKVLDWEPTISVEEGFGRVLKVAQERKAQGL